MEWPQRSGHLKTGTKFDTNSSSSSFIYYSDLRLHCPHISTNKMYIVNTPSESPFGLTSHSIHFYE